MNADEIDVNTLHRRLGHSCEQVTRKAGKSLGLKVSGKFQICEDCAVGKAKQKKLPKISENKSKNVGDRIMFDVSSFKYKSFGYLECI